MAQIKGVDILLGVNTGDDITPVITSIGGQRGATLNRASETLESTHKLTGGWKEFGQSFKEWSIESEGLIVVDDIGYQALEDAYMNGTPVQVQMSMPSGDNFEGEAIVTELPIEAPYDDYATYSVTLQGSGPLTKVPAV